MVLDEADKMLSLGFEPQLTRLRRRLCPPQVRAPPSYQRPQVIHAVEPLVARSRIPGGSFWLTKVYLTFGSPLMNAEWMGPLSCSVCAGEGSGSFEDSLSFGGILD